MPIANSLLAALPRKDCQRMVTASEPVMLLLGEVLYEPGKPIRYVYFPGTSIVSLLMRVDDHMAMEISLIGREGMVGIPLALGIGNSPVRALVQGAGSALRMTSARFRSEHSRCKPLREALGRHIYARIMQISQTAACNRFHLVEGRLARWLLMASDGMATDQFRFTHEVLSNTLGVLRVAVTKAAGALQRRGLIRYSRGQIDVLDRKGLEAAACSCYAFRIETAFFVRAQSFSASSPCCNTRTP